MKGGTRVAVGVAAGYLMGRTKKMKLALMVTAAGVTGNLAKSPGELVRRGAAGLGASGAVEGLVSSVRGELKSAATTAATRRIDALSERLAGGSGGSAGEDEETSRRQRDEEPEDTEREDETGREEEAEDETERESKTKRDEGDRARGGRKAEEPESYRPVRRRASAPPAEERKGSGESRSSASRAARRPSRAGTTTTSTAERRTRR